MAGRIRSIKPEILDDEVTANLSHLEYRLFTGSWLIADDYGNLRADPDYIRGQIVWARRETTSQDVADALDELVAQELLERYEVRGQSYFHITGWAKHQRVDKPGKPRMPGPAEVSRDSREGVANNSRKSRETLAPDLRSPTSDQEEEGEPRARARSHPPTEVTGDWVPEPSVDNAQASAEAAARGVVIPHALAKFRLKRAGPSPDPGRDWRSFLLTEFPTPEPLRESLVRVEREKTARAARDRERTDLAEQKQRAENDREDVRRAAKAALETNFQPPGLRLVSDGDCDS